MKKNFSVLWLIPAKKNSPLDMLFAKRGLDYLETQDVQVIIKNFYETKSILGLLKEVRSVRKLTRERNVDLIHAQFGSTTAMVALLTGLPFVVTFRGTDVNGDPASSHLMNFIRKGMGILAMHFSRGNISVSSQLKSKLGPKGADSTVIPSGTKTELFRPIDKSEACMKLGLNKDLYYIAFASGGRRKVKRYDLALKVCELLRIKGHRIELLEIWNTPHDQVPWMINAAEVTILTSEMEGSPNIVRESLACGVPVVCFDVGDAAQWINQDPSSALVINVQDMVDKVDTILRNPPQRQRRINVEQFSETNSAKKLLNFYRSIHGTL